ncbi:glycosyltransferase family protein 2 [Striga hermonthica]|uniref:Glycosyltransferase family protein 2 n=1 Tax=Striga hermonthica TaxID=68872 RepID=A0A9N7MQQ6_STRHE|nr:glycosyltransferase family protein 2 [Striga hermonthica]
MLKLIYESEMGKKVRLWTAVVKMVGAGGCEGCCCGWRRQGTRAVAVLVTTPMGGWQQGWWLLFVFAEVRLSGGHMRETGFLSRTPTMRSGDYLEGMLHDYMGTKSSGIKPRAQKGSSARLVTVLTCLQFGFAVYATFLLYFMSPSIDLRARPDFSWATRIAHQWRTHFMAVSHYQQPGPSGPGLPSETEADLVYILDDDMIPGKKMLQILSHVAGTDKYKNSVLGSIGRILPFRQKDFTFPSYRKFRSKEAGLYLPDPAYDITIDRVVQVDFLSSSWFLSAELVKTLFIETPFTFMTGEDLHLSYQLQKYRNAGSYVLPVDPNDKETWGDSEHRLAYVSETTVIFKDIVQVRDEQWWKALTTGYITQWAAMNPQKIDALFYAHSLGEVKALAPLLEKFRSTVGKKAYLVVSGGRFCPCEDAALALKWPKSVCTERRFKIFDLGIGALSGGSDSEVPLVQGVHASMKGLVRMHNPSVVVTVSDIDSNVKRALKMVMEGGGNGTALVLLPRASVPKALWMADLRSTALPNWNKMRLSISIITQNRAKSLARLLSSLSAAFYLGDEVPITFNMDSKVDSATLKMVDSFAWPHGPKTQRRRIIQGGLIRAVSESWYPSSDNDFGLLLEDDIEVSPYYYLWVKYALLAYHYDPQVSLPELSSISLYTPRLVEVVKERPKWNATAFFSRIHPNTPYLHQLPCSWGAVFFPKQWREFYVYMNMRFTEDAKQNPVQIPKSRTNGWQASWKKFLIDMMYLRGYVSLYPNFPNQASFSTNHMEPGAHISAKDNVVRHDKGDFEVPLLRRDFREFLPNGKLPPASKLPSLNLFNRALSLKGLKAAGAKLGQDVLECKPNEVVAVHHDTGLPSHCAAF